MNPINTSSSFDLKFSGSSAAGGGPVFKKTEELITYLGAQSLAGGAPLKEHEESPARLLEIDPRLTFKGAKSLLEYLSCYEKAINTSLAESDTIQLETLKGDLLESLQEYPAEARSDIISAALTDEAMEPIQGLCLGLSWTFALFILKHNNPTWHSKDLLENYCASEFYKFAATISFHAYAKLIIDKAESKEELSSVHLQYIGEVVIDEVLTINPGCFSFGKF